MRLQPARYRWKRWWARARGTDSTSRKTGSSYTAGWKLSWAGTSAPARSSGTAPIGHLCQGGLQQRAQHALQGARPGVVPGEAVLVHVGALADLQLHRIHGVARIAVMTGDVTALEPAVGHPVVILLRRQH